MIRTRFLAVSLFTALTGTTALAGAADLSLTVLYDNYAFVPGLQTDWGFSCLIEGTEKTLLFDTGNNEAVLLQNMERLHKTLRSADAIVISHEHVDHTAGLGAALKDRIGMDVFVPYLYPSHLLNGIRNLKANAIQVKDPTEVCPHVRLTGGMKAVAWEQSLILETREGLVIVVGCSHPSIVDIVKKAKEITGREVYLVLGGFHMLSQSDTQVRNIVDQMKQLGVKKIAPCHCTGDKAIARFKAAYGEDFIQVGVGRVLQLPELDAASVADFSLIK